MARGSAKTPLLLKPGGVKEVTDIADVPEGFLLGAQNFLVRNGKGRPRPGYSLVGSQLAAADRVIGFGFRGAPGVSTNLVAHTLSAAYSWNGSAFSAITGTWAASTADQPVRFTTFAYGTPLTTWLFRINAANAIDKWDGTGSFVDAGGSPPAGKDITSTNARVVLFDDTGMQWSAFNNPDSWTATDRAEFTETTDIIVGGRAFGPLSCAVWKEDSLWVAQAQAATAPFQIQYVGPIPGPPSPSAIVGFLGLFYWLGKNGAVYSFDGSRAVLVSDDLAETVRDNWEWAVRARVHGFVIVAQQPELWFVYPRQITNALTEAISINLVTGAVTPHRFAHSITAASEWIMQPSVTWDGLTGTWDTLVNTYATWDDMASASTSTAVLGDDTGRVLQMGIPNDDRGTAIAWNFEHGWKAAGGLGKRVYLDGVASYWKQTTAALTVTVGVKITDTLGEAETATEKTFDMSTDSNHLLTYPDKIGQWVNVRHSASSVVAGMEHRGAAILGWPRAMT